LTESLEYYIGLHDFTEEKIIEHWLLG
jgi:hypothetical protein